VTTDSLQQLTEQLRLFAEARQWQAFHSPKNLASALVVEAAELLEPFQWLTEVQSRTLPPETHAAVASEIADVLLYLVQLASALGIDPVAAAQAKLQANALRFPVAGAAVVAESGGPSGDETDAGLHGRSGAVPPAV